jgi:hypothetical protein
MLHTGLLITVLANWSDDRTLLDKLVSLFRTSLCTLSLRGSSSVLNILLLLTTTTRPSVITTPAYALHLTLDFEHCLASF